MNTIILFFIIVSILLLIILYFKQIIINQEIDKCKTPLYQPYLWNNPIYQDKNNCYSYAIQDRDKHRKTKMYPGEHSNLPRVKQTMNTYTCDVFENRLFLDIPNMFVSNYEDKCPCDYYKIALVLDNDNNNKDFHFYREDADGLWSHKPGSNKVIRVDASDNIIKNPFTADRDYSKKYNNGYNYATKCNFYCIPYNHKFNTKNN